jgi:hypothetical protein
MLEKSGYLPDWVFDNCGTVLLEDIGSEVLASLNRYLLVQQSKRSARTLYYYDILAAKPPRRDTVSLVMNAYKQFVLPDPGRQVSRELRMEVTPTLVSA